MTAPKHEPDIERHMASNARCKRETSKNETNPEPAPTPWQPLIRV